ncbi:hypothetical protein [Paenibacillus amylolyticus]|nr:hypothetical protein [Paenibacillus amylolyticus]
MNTQDEIWNVEPLFRDVLFYNHQYHDAIQMSILEDEFRQRHMKDQTGND